LDGAHTHMCTHARTHVRTHTHAHTCAHTHALTHTHSHASNLSAAHCSQPPPRPAAGCRTWCPSGQASGKPRCTCSVSTASPPSARWRAGTAGMTFSCCKVGGQARLPASSGWLLRHLQCVCIRVILLIQFYILKTGWCTSRPIGQGPRTRTISRLQHCKRCWSCKNRQVRVSVASNAENWQSPVRESHTCHKKS